MKIALLDLIPSVEVERGPDGLAGRTSVESTVTIKLLPETVDEADLLMRVPPAMGTLNWLRRVADCVLHPEPTPSLAPSIVVSVRPATDGAPSMAMVIRPGVTQIFPIGMLAYTAKGDLVHLSVPLEVRASVIDR